MTVPVVVSLFDFTGVAVEPWAASGYDCYCFDIQHEGVKGYGRIKFVHWDAEDGIDPILHLLSGRRVVFVFSFTPCTDVAVSGARHFTKKLASDPDTWNRAVRWARLAETLSETYGCPFVVENPVSMLSTLWRRPDYIFHPSDYGWYLDPDDTHPRWPDYIPEQDAYTKRTCFWTSKSFIMPPKEPVEPMLVEVRLGSGRVTKSSPFFAKLGGKSLKTKNIRSATPRGISRAVFLVNKRESHFGVT